MRKMKCLFFSKLDECIGTKCPYYEDNDWDNLDAELFEPARKAGIHIIYPSRCTRAWFAYIRNDREKD